MYQKLQHNFDILQYLLKDISADQLVWHNGEDNPTLGEIIERLNRLEQSHHAALTTHLAKRPVLCFASGGMEAFVPKQERCLCKFETYVEYRRQILAYLKDIDAPHLQTKQLYHAVNIRSWRSVDSG